MDPSNIKKNIVLEEPRNSVLTDLAGIPLAITQEHDEALFYWQQQGIKDATLMHIDGHSDMTDKVGFKTTNKLDLNIANFIAAATYLGIVKDIYWLNPHSRMLKANKGLETTIQTKRGFQEIVWNGELYKIERLRNHEGKYLEEDQVKYESPLILDLDLDAFSCQRAVCDLPPPRMYDGEIPKEVDQRFRLTKRFLEKQLERLKIKPSLITIARSINNDPENPFPEQNTYVNPDKVNNIQKRTIEMLAEIYK